MVVTSSYELRFNDLYIHAIISENITTPFHYFTTNDFKFFILFLTNKVKTFRLLHDNAHPIAILKKISSQRIISGPGSFLHLIDNFI